MMGHFGAHVGTRLLFAILMASSTVLAETQARNRDKSFDYVVVGGGTAGLALAARLAEDSSHSVAVIEAGGFYEQDNGNISVVPAYCTIGAGTDPADFNPLVDWGFVTQPQKGLDGRRIHYTRGKTLGGTSARNYMYYHRPNVGSLDQWAEIAGDDSYKFDNLLPFFKKSVRYTSPSVPFTNSTNDQDPNAWSSAGGPVQLSYGKFIDPFGTWVQPAVEKLGMAAINGFQSGKLLGNAYLPFTIDPQTSQRSSSESSFLNSLPRKARLHIYHHALAEKVLLDKHNRATGVVVSSNNTRFTVKARREVILSAGTFQSPQLLMLSGIGPAATLAKHNIPLRIDLPGVGSNLQDHVWFGTQFRVSVPTGSVFVNDPTVLDAARQAYNKLATGPLTIPATGFLAWEKVPPHFRKNLSTSTSQALDALPPDWPELELLPVNAYLGYQRNYPQEDPADGYSYATLGTLLAAPLSRGSVSISSANPADPPLIDPNWLTHPADIELAVVAVRRQREVWAQMQGVTIGDEVLPGRHVQSDADILGFVKQAVAPAPHASGTCRMGKKEDRGSVVDSMGRVYGAQGLRVVDASVFPLLPAGHPTAMVYAVAEKIAEGILGGM
ncbi:MAG: hypothetical protein LQ344_001924 [Seirophora lacunosa]|nr:MAG: hypothetical protein LQ344_001924 [Seirophora lacunosa]